MISDLSQTLFKILRQTSLPTELANSQIEFDRPTGQFNPQMPTINLFLYDIRENVELRDNELLVERDRLRTQATIRCPPIRMDCTYLVTAWTMTGQDIALQEHRLLSQIFQVFSRYPDIPETFLQGQLKQQPFPVPLDIHCGDRLKNASEFWTSLGIPPRAYLAVTATISMTPWLDSASSVRLVQQTHLKLESMSPDLFPIGGTVKDINFQPIPQAIVELVEVEKQQESDGAGEYEFRAIAAGTYTLRVTSPSGSHSEFPITVPSIAGGPYDLRLT
ncbi:MAG: Pvc16 family protein [Thermosynechococcaceae cyanobacterium]